MTKPNDDAYEYEAVVLYLRQLARKEPRDERWRLEEVHAAILLAIRNGKMAYRQREDGSYEFYRTKEAP